MKRSLVLISFLIFSYLGFAQTSLSVGDIAITGVNMDNPDEISVVFLVDIQNGTEIKFTDNGWKSDDTWRGGEGTHTWTAGQAYTAGDEIIITISGPSFSGDGDQVIAYQNVSDIIAAINDDGTNVWQADATSASTSALPMGLTNTTNCVALTETDNIKYDRSITVGTKAELLNAINDYTNWSGHNTTPQALSTAGFTVNTVAANTSYPWTEDFENGGFYPTDWSTEFESGNVDWSFIEGGHNGNPASAHGGTYNARFFSSNAGDKVKLISPPMDLTSLSNPVLSFWHTQANWNLDQDELRIYYRTSSGGAWTLISGQEYTILENNWTERSDIALPNPSSEYYIAFEGLSGYGYGVCIDDVTVKELVIPEPLNHVINFASSQVGSAQLDLSWEDNEDYPEADGFLIVGKTSTGSYYTPVDLTDPADDTDWSDGDFSIKVSSGEEAYSVTNLASSTLYDFKIYPYKGSGTAINFKTSGTIPTINTYTYDAKTVAHILLTPQPQAADISSILDTPAEAFGIINLNLQDQIGLDFEPTYVQNIRMKPHSTNTADWTDHIAGVVVSDVGGNISTQNVSITDSYIDISFSSGDLSVADNSLKTISLSVYLNNTGIIDNKILSFLIDEDDHGFTTFNTGSSFSSTFGTDITSNDFTIEVTPTELQFVQNVSEVDVWEYMSPAPTVAFTDANGNIDLDLGGAEIHMYPGAVGMINPPAISNINGTSGLASFSTLQFTAPTTNASLGARDADDQLGETWANVISNNFDVVRQLPLTITEVMQNPTSVDDGDGEWFEIYNDGSTDIDINGFIIKDAGTDMHTIVNAGGLIVSAGSFIVLGNNDNSSTNGGLSVNYEYSGITLTNTGDELLLYEDDGTTLIDRVEWDGGTDWPNPAGASMYFVGSSADHNNDGGSWKEAKYRENNFDDNNTDKGSPGTNGLDQNLISTTTWTGVGNWSQGNAPGNSNWSYGSPGAAVNVIINGECTVDMEPDDPAYCKDLTINATRVLKIGASKALTLRGTLINNAGTNGLILKSDVNGASSLLHQTNNVSATVESYFTDLGDWYLVSPPVSSATAYVFLNDYVDYWDETQDSWVGIGDETTHLNVGQGYSVKKLNSKTVSYAGNLNNGSLQNSSLTRTGGGSYEGWNLVGNPYPSVYNTIFLSTTNLNSGVSVWPHTGNSSAYLSYSFGSGGSIEAQYIQPGQGFMVEVTNGFATGSINFDNHYRTHQNLGLIDKKKNSSKSLEKEILKIQVYGELTTIDETYLAFREGSTLDFDSFYDVHKLFGAIENPHIFSFVNIEENEKVAIQGIPQPADGDAIPLGTRIGVSGEYKLAFSGVRTFADDQAFILLDKKTNESYKIIHDSIFSFYMDVNDSQNRFDILFKMTTGIDEIAHEKDMIVYMNNGRLYINLLEEIDDQFLIEIYNVLGQKMTVDKTENVSDGISLDLPSAYYMIKVSTADKSYVQKFYHP